MADYVEMLKWLLVNENNYSEEEADIMIKKNPSIVSYGIMKGTPYIRSTIMTLERVKEKTLTV